MNPRPFPLQPRSLAEVERQCALCGKVFVPHDANVRYCGRICGNMARSGARTAFGRRGFMRGAQTVAAQSNRARAIDDPTSTPATIEHRQEPPQRPRYRLTFDRRVIIGPDRPAPQPYCNGWLPLFCDDLGAIADHGSPSPIPRPDSVWHSPSGSALARMI